MTDGSFTYRILVAGPPAVGKSSLIQQFTRRTFDPEYDPTIEDSYRKNILIDKDASVLEITDLGGQQDDIKEALLYTRGCIVVYDLTRKASLEFAVQILDKVQAKTSSEIYPIYLVGCKADLVDKREVTPEDVDAAFGSRSRVLGRFEVSSKTFHPVLDEIFLGLVKLIRNSKQSDYYRAKAQVAGRLTVLANRAFEIVIFKAPGLHDTAFLAALLNHPEPNKVPELKKVTVDGKVFSINLSVSTKLFRDYISHGRMLLIEATDFAAFETISQTPYAPKVDSRVYNDRPLFLVLLLPDNAEAEICVPADRVAELASKWRATFIETKMTQLHQHFQKLILETNRVMFRSVTRPLKSTIQKHVTVAPIIYVENDVYRDLSWAIDNTDLSDLVLEVEGQEIHTHRAILYARSSSFRKLLDGEWQDKSRVVVEGVKYKVMKGLLRCLYVGELDLTKSERIEALDVYKAPVVELGEEMFQAFQRFNVDAVTEEIQKFQRSEIAYKAIKTHLTAVHESVIKVAAEFRKVDDTKLSAIVEISQSVAIPLFCDVAKFLLHVAREYGCLSEIHKIILSHQVREKSMDLVALVANAFHMVHAAYSAKAGPDAEVGPEKAEAIEFARKKVIQAAVWIETPILALKTRLDLLVAAKPTHRMTQGMADMARDIDAGYCRVLHNAEERVTPERIDKKFLKKFESYMEDAIKIETQFKDADFKHRDGKALSETLRMFADLLMAEHALTAIREFFGEFKDHIDTVLKFIPSDKLRDLGREFVEFFLTKHAPPTEITSSTRSVDALSLFDKQTDGQAFASDVTFYFPEDTRVIRAHKVFMATHSDAFRKMFTGFFREKHERVIPVTLDNYETFRTVLKFIYSNGNLNLSNEITEELKKTNLQDQVNAALNLLISSTQLEVQPLRKQTEKFILSLAPNLALGEMVELWAVLETYAATDVAEYYKQQILRRFASVQNLDTIRPDLANKLKEESLTFKKEYLNLQLFVLGSNETAKLQLISAIITGDAEAHHLTPEYILGYPSYTKFMDLADLKSAALELIPVPMDIEQVDLKVLVDTLTEDDQALPRVGFIIIYDTENPDDVGMWHDLARDCLVTRGMGVSRFANCLLVATTLPGTDFTTLIEQMDKLSTDLCCEAVSYRFGDPATTLEEGLRKMIGVHMLQDTLL